MVNFSMICLSTCCTVVLEHYCSCDGLFTVEPVLKGTCIEIPPVYKDHLKVLLSSLYPQSVYMYFCGLWCLKKDAISYPKNISAIKKGYHLSIKTT